MLQAQPDPGVKVTPEIMNQAVAIYNKRLNALGTTEPTIQKDGTDRIDIQLPGEKDPNRVNNLIGSTGHALLPAAAGRASPRRLALRSSSGAGISEKNSLWELLDPAQGQAEGSTSLYAFDNNKRPRNTQPAKTKEQLLQQLQVTTLPAGWTQLACRRARSPSPARRPRPARARVDRIHARARPTGTCSTCRRTLDQLLHRQGAVEAKADFDPQTGQPVVSMTFNDRGGKLFKEITRKLAAQGKADYDAAKATDPTAQPLNYVRSSRSSSTAKLETYPYIDFQRTRTASARTRRSPA